MGSLHPFYAAERKLQTSNKCRDLDDNGRGSPTMLLDLPNTQEGTTSDERWMSAKAKDEKMHSECS